MNSLKANDRAVSAARWAVLLVGVVTPVAATEFRAVPFVWGEAEAIATSNIALDGTTQPATILSGGAALKLFRNRDEVAKLPPEGVQWRYTFETSEAGTWDLWVRVGMEGVRPPYEWRVDGGPWQTFSPTGRTVNLVALDVWMELAWALWGRVDLAKGRHTLELRVTQPGRDGRVLILVDCWALVRGPWVPEGRLRPGEHYDGSLDREAAAHQFRLPEIPPPEEPRFCLPLTGLWQVARYDDPDMNRDRYAPVEAIPEAERRRLRWMGIRIPADAWQARPELALAHRLIFRTRLWVPEAWRGRSFLLHFSGTCWIASVFVNGRFVDARQSVLVPWCANLTSGIEAGRENVVEVVVKGPYYALDVPDLEGRRNLPRQGVFPRNVKWVDAVFPSTKGEGDGLAVGIVNPVKLVVTGPAYVSDVYVRTSVTNRRLEVDMVLTNSTDQAFQAHVTAEAVHDRTGTVEKRLPEQEILLPAASATNLRLEASWPEVRLWWPSEGTNDLPDCYRLRTTVSCRGRMLDRREDLFGFRDIRVRGQQFLLNGIPWHFWNWVDVRASTPEEWFVRYHQHHNRFHRCAADHDRLFGHREQALEWLDRHGIPSRLSTCVDGMFITHNLRNPQVWANFSNHVRQVVLAYRNHPSIVHWSIENEVMLITAYNTLRGEYELHERRMAEIGRMVETLDPTRPWYSDGGGDLGGVSPVHCVHYSTEALPDVPRLFYAYPTGPTVVPRRGSRAEVYLWDGQRPWLGGEEFYYAGQLDLVDWIGGPMTYRGRSFADQAAGRALRMIMEGARWQGVGGLCPWTGPLPGGTEKSFAPQAVFVREYNSCFFPRSSIIRTIRLFNDTRFPAHLTLAWRVVLDRHEVDRGERVYALPPGDSREDTLTLSLPEAGRRLDGVLELTLRSGSTVVFEDSRPISVLPSPARPVPLEPTAFAVYDPEGTVVRTLTAWGQPFTALNRLEEMNRETRLLLVGAFALSGEPRSRLVEQLRRLVQAGHLAIVLEQTVPLEKDELPVKGIRAAVPADSHQTWGEFSRRRPRSGSIAHPVARAHPVLRGLRAEDFQTWAGGETNFIASYAVPESGAIPLVQAGSGLTLAPMLEVPVGRGRYLLSQLLVASRLGIEPTADQLLYNMIVWAVERANAVTLPVTLISGQDNAFATAMERLGLRLRSASEDAGSGIGERGIGEVLQGPPCILIVRASARLVAQLARNADAVRRFCEQGGWIMLAGLEDDGLKDFNALVGVPHRLRPFRAEAVRIEAFEDVLLLGLSDRDFTQFGNEMIAPWRRQRRVSDRVFTSVVDAGPEIAAFGGASPKLTDGLTHEDFWHYVLYLKNDGSETVSFSFDRPEAVTGICVWTSSAYYVPRTLEISVDGEHTERFSLPDPVRGECLSLGVPPARTLSLRVVDYHPAEKSKPLVTIDEVQIFRTLPQEYARRVVPLTRPSGLVKYPLGRGGILLNQLDLTREDEPENMARKRLIYSSLLRNMGAVFEGPPTGPDSP